ncbi:hypothetical protein JCM16358_26030 [Halanaerocella petrolearia]
MVLAELILQSSPFIVITYLIIKIDIFSQGLMTNLEWKRKSYLSIGLILCSLGLFYFFRDYQILIYAIGIILCGRLFGFPYGSLSGILFFLLGNQIANLNGIILLLGLISDLYQLSLLDKLNIRLKDLIISILLGFSLILISQKQSVSLYTLAFYGSFTIITNHKLQLQSFQNQKLEIRSACQARDSLEQLHSINEKLISNFNLSEACDELLRISCQQLDISYGSLLLYNEESDCLELKAEYGLGKKYSDEFKISQIDCLSEALKTEDILIIDNLESVCFGQRFTLREEVESILMAPIFSQDQLKGVFVFLAPQKDFFSNLDLIPLQTVIDQAPLVIKKAEIFERLERNVAGLSMLQRTSHIINSTLNTDQVFEHTVDMVMGTMGVSMAGLFLFNRDKVLELVSAKGVPELEKEAIVKAAKEVTSEVIDDEKILINDNAKEIEEKYSFDTIDVKSVMFVPLKIRGEVIGAIAAAQTDFERQFKGADRKFITTLANQVAIAIENARIYNQMKNMAIRDGLTKLYNHSYFQDRLGKEIKKSNRYKRDLALLMLDIDNFKNFNDTYGHQAGDEVLRSIAQVLEDNVRGADLVARYGGEEFAIILPETDELGAYQMGQRVNDLVREENIKYNDLELNVTVSIGVAIYQFDQSKKEFINQADQALYEAKDRGKDRIYVA